MAAALPLPSGGAALAQGRRDLVALLRGELILGTCDEGQDCLVRTVMQNDGDMLVLLAPTPPDAAGAPDWQRLAAAVDRHIDLVHRRTQAMQAVLRRIRQLVTGVLALLWAGLTAGPAAAFMDPEALLHWLLATAWGVLWGWLIYAARRWALRRAVSWLLG